MEFVVIRRSVGAPVDENKQVSVCISHAMHTYHTILYGYGCKERKQARGRSATIVLVIITITDKQNKTYTANQY